MAKSVLNVEPRVRIGKGGSRKVRRDGMVPAVIYGKGMEALNLRVDPRALREAIATEAGWNTLITLKGDGPFDGKVVILKDLQIDAIRRDAQHVDFLAINLKNKIAVMIPVHPVGKSLGEKEGGTLQLVRHELEVLCLPTDIPTAIEIDVTALNVGDVVHIQEMYYNKGYIMCKVYPEPNVDRDTGRVAGRAADGGGIKAVPLVREDSVSVINVVQRSRTREV